MSFSTESSFSQVDAYPWTAALLRDEDIQADYMNSKCAAVIVSNSSNMSSNQIPHIVCFGRASGLGNLTNSCPLQIGNRFALTAAHCLYDDDNEELLPASSFSIMLGLHDRRKTKEPNR